MTIINYSLNYQPGPTLDTFKAVYNVSFATDGTTQFNVWGSYYDKFVPTLTLYINNKTNSNVINVTSNDPTWNRQVPPYSEAYFNVAGFSQVTLNANGGSCDAEFYNWIHQEEIFQRTDSTTNYVSFPISNIANGTNAGDLVDIDGQGIIFTASNTTVAANNITSSYPVTSGTMTTITNTRNAMPPSNGMVDSNGNLVVFAQTGTNTTTSPMYANINGNATYTVNAGAINNYSGYPSVFETLNYWGGNWHGLGAMEYLTKSSYSVGSTSKANVLTGTGYGELVIGDPLTNNAWYLLSTTSTSISMYSFTMPNALTNNAVGLNIVKPLDMTCLNYGKYRQDGKIIYCVLNSSFAVLSVNVVDSTTKKGISTLAPSSNINNSFRLNGGVEIFNLSSSLSAVPVNLSTGPAIILIDSNGNQSTLALDTNPTINNWLCGAILPNGNLFMAWPITNAVKWAQVTPTGAIVSTGSIPVSNITNIYYVVLTANHTLIYMNVGGAYYISRYDSTTNTLTTPVSANNSGLHPFNPPNADWAATMAQGNNTYYNATDQIAQSIFGVYKGNGNVALSGYFNINQTFSGSTSFNQNSANVVGNRGVVTNNVVQLNGLS